MLKQVIKLSEARELEIVVTNIEGGHTTSQVIIEGGVRPQSKNCTVTCYSGGSSYSYSWTCRDNQSCSGDCSVPTNPRGSCS
jgi:hypothetical protein